MDTNTAIVVVVIVSIAIVGAAYFAFSRSSR